MPYKITLEKQNFPGVLRNNNTQGHSPMHSYLGLIGSWDIFLPQAALRLLIQNNSAGAEVPRILSFVVQESVQSQWDAYFLCKAGITQPEEVFSPSSSVALCIKLHPACLEKLPSSEKTPLIQCPDGVLGRQQAFCFSPVRAESFKNLRNYFWLPAPPTACKPSFWPQLRTKCLSFSIDKL